jgi:hypothetical protein
LDKLKGTVDGAIGLSTPHVILDLGS